MIRGRRTCLRGLGKRGRLLLAECDEHWRFEVREAVPDGGDVIALGALGGVIASSGPAGELHHAGDIVPVARVVPEYPYDDAVGEACLRLRGAAPQDRHCRPGAVVFPAQCGNWVH
ncbi:hypothetical protein ACIGXF_15750 [Streptomyces sp. NPDC053086]|uniref:hypothetical protein n=1 Tax=unclassified Streptomyces TaxID=2593676 RepID=UPI0037D2533E